MTSPYQEIAIIILKPKPQSPYWFTESALHQTRLPAVLPQTPSGSFRATVSMSVSKANQVGESNWYTATKVAMQKPSCLW